MSFKQPTLYNLQELRRIAFKHDFVLFGRRRAINYNYVI